MVTYVFNMILFSVIVLDNGQTMVAGGLGSDSISNAGLLRLDVKPL